MLIRLVNHPQKNKAMIDKLISIKGLNPSMFFMNRGGHVVLRKPWSMDNPKNTPMDIVQKFAEPFDFERDIAPSEKGQETIWRKQTGSCLLLDYSTVEGEAAWKTIERIIDSTLPRDARIPEPVVVGTLREWKVSAADIPEVDLRVAQPSIPTQEEPKPVNVSVSLPECTECGKTFQTKQGALLHMRKAKHGKAKVA